MRPHQRLVAWRLSFAFLKDVYVITRHFPIEEKFGLVSQLRRAAVSVPANIAEGAARQTRKEFRRFLFFSSGSISELDTLLQLSFELGFIDKNSTDTLLKKLDSITKLVLGLKKSLN